MNALCLILFDTDKPSEEPYHMVRLLTYVPGQIFAKIPCTAEMLFKVGKYVAQLQQALQVSLFKIINRSII